jgi:hypothetical protein
MLLGAYLLLAVAASLQEWLLSRAPDPYTHYNNYVIFRQSFAHLVRQQDLYRLYLPEYWDYFRYSPAFALAFGVFAALPDAAGLLLWNLLNAAALFGAWMYLPATSERMRVAAGWFVALEMMTALQNAQSNVLIAGLLIVAFGCLERRRTGAAAFLVVAAACVKLFALAALALIVLYPERRKFLVSAAWSAAGLALAPLLVVSPVRLAALYASWARLLAMDFAQSDGLSIFGWLHSWFHLAPPKLPVMLGGLIVLGWALLAARRSGSLNGRLLALANVLIWVVIFNHKAESSTYAIAICGVAIWIFSQPPAPARARGVRGPGHRTSTSTSTVRGPGRRTSTVALGALAFVFTCLSATAMFPFPLKSQVFAPYDVKAVPCILIWMKMTFDMVAASRRLRPATLVACHP